jgi:periplasmic copper chaperone A
MRLSALFAGLCFTGLVLSAARAAEAHVSLASGPAAAAKSQKITFGVGHGCEGSDTLRIRVDIPAGVTSVRPLFSDFGKPTVIRNGTTVTAVEWTKANADVLDADDAYYELTIRARVPDAAFTQIQFNITQVCRSAQGVETTVMWDQAPGGTGNPAPMLTVVPARTSGWNKIVVGRAVAAAELPIYLGDAQIVWRGNAAYSANAATMAQIAQTQGVTALTGDLAAGDELWIRY